MHYAMRPKAALGLGALAPCDFSQVRGPELHLQQRHQQLSSSWSPPLSVTCTRSEMPRSNSAMVMEVATSSRNGSSVSRNARPEPRTT